MEIDDDLIADEPVHFIARRPVLTGSFAISRASIPFFQASMLLEDAVRDLELVENIPSDLQAQWRLEELFQREIDWRRVEHEIVDGYLRRPEKLQFFNAITVALLPLDDGGMIATEYGDGIVAQDVPERYTKSPWRIERLGGVELITTEGSPHGHLRWAPKRIFPATIDGQHRLAALKQLVDRGNLTKANRATSIPVLFLILDKRVGFEITHGHDDGNQILSVVREIFIDLNKSAREVTRARRILLDDQEIESRCVRAMIAGRVGERTVDRLPLGLVHWQHRVTAKFNSGDQTAPFVTTVELLHSILREILDIRTPKDPNDEQQIVKFIESVEDALGVSDVISRHPAKYPGLPPLGTYVEQHYLKEGFEQPLANLPAPYIRASIDGFVERWREPLLAVLTRFRPYSDFIKIVDEEGGISGEIAYYMCLPRRAQQQQVKEWGEERVAKLDAPLRRLHEMKQSDWAFFAVFQKGLLVATATAWKHWAVLSPGQAHDQQSFLGAWLGFLNGMWERGVFAVRAQLGSASSPLWSGIALNPGSKTVKWNNATVGRVSGLLILWWYLYFEKVQRIGSFVKAVEAPRSDEKFPRAKAAYAKLVEGLKSAVVGPEEEVGPEEVKKRVASRVRKILALALAEMAPKSSQLEDEEEEREVQESVAESGALESSEAGVD